MSLAEDHTYQNSKLEVLRGVVFEGPSGAYVASFLEIDMVGQGSSCVNARKNLLHTLAMAQKMSEEHGFDIVDHYGPAPKEIQDLWKESDAVDTFDGELPPNSLTDRILFLLLPNSKVLHAPDSLVRSPSAGAVAVGESD